MSHYSTTLRLIDGYMQKENLVENPSIEPNIDGYTKNPDYGGSIARSSVKAYKGSYSLLYTHGDVNLEEGVSVYAVDGSRIKVHEGTPYWFSLWFLVVSQEDWPLRARIDWYDKNGSLIHTSVKMLHGNVNGSTSVWKLLLTGDIAPAGAVEARPHTVFHMDAFTFSFYMDAVQFWEGIDSDNEDYMDGDQPGCEWENTPHASKSIKGHLRGLVDFIYGDTFHLLENGLELPAPEAVRLMGGDPLLSDRGQRLIDRKYNNREILIRFKVTGQSGEDLRQRLVELQTILDNAVRASRTGLTGSVVLEWAGETIPEPVYFDIVDGEVNYDLSSTVFARNQTMLENEVTLTAKPYARAKYTTRLSNHVINHDFDSEYIVSGMDGEEYRTFGSSGDRLERANCTNLKRASDQDGSFTIIAAIHRTAGDVVQVIARAGNVEADATPLNRGAYELALDAANKARFIIYKSDGTPYTLTGNTVLSQDADHIIVVVYADRSAVEDYDYIALYVDGELDGYTESALGTASMRDTTGKFTVGADDQDGNRFNGRIQNLAVVLVPFTGADVAHITKAGTKCLTGEHTAYTNRSFWNLSSSNWGASWPDFSASPVEDAGPNSLDLTVVGTPAAATKQRLPLGWSVGSALDVASGSGLKEVGDEPFSPRAGRFMFRFKKTGVDANSYIKQTITIPDHKKNLGQNLWWTAVLWLKAVVDNQHPWVALAGAVSTSPEKEINVADGWTQFILVFYISSGSTFDIKIYAESATNVDFVVDSVQILEGTPFGIRTFQTITQTHHAGVPTVILPQISSRFLARDEFRTNGKVPYLTVRDVPGDQPAGCRLCLENVSAVSGVLAYGPMRVGLQYGGEPSKFISSMRATVLLVYSDTCTVIDDAHYGLVNEISDPQHHQWKVLGIHPVGSLIAEPSIFRGTFKFLAGLGRKWAWDGNTYAMLKVIGPFGAISLTHSPTKIAWPMGGTPTYDVDVGNLIWPPGVSVDGLLGRKTQGLFPHSYHPAGLTPAQGTRFQLEIAHDDENAPDYLFVQWIDILPCEDGFFQLAPSGTSGEMAVPIWPAEILVINSIDSEGSPVCVRNRPGVHVFEDSIPSLDNAASVTYTGDVFQLMPTIPNMFTILPEVRAWESIATGSRPNTEAEEESIVGYVEYEARYLYV